MPYEAIFSVGAPVEISDRVKLEDFRRTWKYHNPLIVEQLAYAGKSAIVARVGFYHGGIPDRLSANRPKLPGDSWSRA